MVFLIYYSGTFNRKFFRHFPVNISYVMGGQTMISWKYHNCKWRYQDCKFGTKIDGGIKSWYQNCKPKVPKLKIVKMQKTLPHFLGGDVQSKHMNWLIKTCRGDIQVCFCLQRYAVVHCKSSRYQDCNFQNWKYQNSNKRVWGPIIENTDCPELRTSVPRLLKSIISTKIAIVPTMFRYL